MTATSADSSQFEVFSGIISERLGLHFDESRESEVLGILAERMAEDGCEKIQDYFERLTSSSTSESEWRVLAEKLTVSETYFLRNPNQFRVLMEVAIGSLRNSQDRREIRILSAGCASGEEPYSLAILLKEQEGLLAGWNVSMRAIDINRKSLDKARAGRYSSWSLRQVPPEWPDRFFHLDGGMLRLDEKIRDMVSFEERNLLEPDPRFWAPCAFDIVLCRNVIMYFSPESGREVMARIASSIKPGGYLFLGHAETLRGISMEFQLLQSHETFYYQRRFTSGNEQDTAAPEQVEGRPVPEAGSPPCRTTPDTSWFEAIQRTMERIVSVTGRRTRASGKEMGAPPPVTGMRPDGHAAAGALWEIGPVRKAFQEERFGEVLRLLAQLPREAQSDSEALLLRAVVLVNRADLQEAEDAVHSILKSDDLNPGAHYVMALCCEHSGRIKEAMKHFRSAIYLERSFAMAHLHLGRLSRREGDVAAARRELRQAWRLLPGEDAARILLFGGGFQRAALVASCRAELQEVGERV